MPSKWLLIFLTSFPPKLKTISLPHPSYMVNSHPITTYVPSDAFVSHSPLLLPSINLKIGPPRVFSLVTPQTTGGTNASTSPLTKSSFPVTSFSTKASIPLNLPPHPPRPTLFFKPIHTHLCGLPLPRQPPLPTPQPDHPPRHHLPKQGLLHPPLHLFFGLTPDGQNSPPNHPKTLISSLLSRLHRLLLPGLFTPVPCPALISKSGS